MRIDSHQHFWRRSRGDYAWLRPDDPALTPLLRDFEPADLQPALQAAGVSRTVLIQAADTVAETEFLLEQAARHEFVGGVVGWADLGRDDAAALIEDWSRRPKFKGVRPMLQDLPDADWIASAPRRAPVQALVRKGLRFDALVKPAHLEALLAFARAWPDLPIVIDHAAKPQLAQGWNADWAIAWRRHMAELAALPQVHCKLSGLLTEMAPADRGSEASALAALRPAWDALLHWFGPARLMWGSDWPVLQLAGDYAGWVALSERLIGELSADEQAQVRRGCAQRFYGIG